MASDQTTGPSPTTSELADFLVANQDEIVRRWTELAMGPKPSIIPHTASRAEHRKWFTDLLMLTAEHIRNPEAAQVDDLLKDLTLRDFSTHMAPTLVIEGQLGFKRIVLDALVKSPSFDLQKKFEMRMLLETEVDRNIGTIANYYAQLTRDMTRSIDRVIAVDEIAEAISASLEINKVFRVVARELKRLIKFDRASLALYDRSRKDFELVALQSRGTPKLKRATRLPASNSRVGNVMSTGRAIIEPDLVKSKAFWEDEMLIAEGIRSCMLMPLMVKGRAIGTFNMGSRELGAFHERDAIALQHIVRQMGIAVENARLYSELKQHHRELTHANRELRRLDQLKSDFLANVSHELRTPLVSVIGYTEMLLAEQLGQVTDRQRKALSITQRNLSRLLKLIQDLLDMAKIQQGQLKLEIRDFPLQSVVDTCLRTLEPVIKDKSIAADVRLPVPPLIIRADEDRVIQVLVNVLSNATKFTGLNGRIAVTAERQSDAHALVKVADTGCGIPARELPFVFQRFRQADGSSTRRFGGIGLGLSIAREILEAHDCTIGIQSSEGKGTTVSLTLPLAPTPAADSTIIMAVVAPPEGHNPPRSPS